MGLPRTHEIHFDQNYINYMDKKVVIIILKFDSKFLFKYYYNHNFDNNLNSIIEIPQMDNQSPSKFYLPPLKHKNFSQNNSFAEKSIIPLQRTSQQNNSNMYMGINQILTYQNINSNIIYVPAYLRIQINRVNRMDYIGCVAEVDAYLTLWLMIKEFPNTIQKQIINNGQLRINGNKVIYLKDIVDYKNNSEYSKNLSKNVIRFHFKQVLTMQLETNAFWAPFQVVNLLSTIELRPIKLPNILQSEQKINKNNSNVTEKHTNQELDEFRNTDIVFNFMRTKTFLQFSFNELRNLGTFDLAQGKVGISLCNEQDFGKMKFSSQEIIQDFILPMHIKTDKKTGSQTQQEEQKLINSAPNAYQNAKIIIAMYKYPIATIINVFVPFYLLSLLSLGVFFQSNDFTGRLLSIFMLLTSYIAMIPGIRASIPPTPNLILIEIIVYLQTLCIMLIFVQSLSVKDIIPEQYQFIWYEDPSFLIVMGYSILNFLLISTLCLLHKLKWQHEYNELPHGTEQLDNQQQINTDTWQNTQGQQLFTNYINKKKIRIAYPKALQSYQVKNNVKSVKLIQIKTKQIHNAKDKPQL